MLRRMFTGIVEETGKVSALDGSQLEISCQLVLKDVKAGDSIAVNGCCLTVTVWNQPEGWMRFDLSEETFKRTSLGDLAVNSPVNLERPVRLVDRLGGHLVQGHVDGVGTVLVGGEDLTVQIPPELAKYVVEKGSITVDGVSLTVVLPEIGSGPGFSTALIPHTLASTNLGSAKPGDRVNIEVDVMAKYAERLLAETKQG